MVFTNQALIMLWDHEIKAILEVADRADEVEDSFQPADAGNFYGSATALQAQTWNEGCNESGHRSSSFTR